MLPKRRTSRSKKNKRRAHDAIKKPALIRCPQCHEFTLPHRTCQYCGYYKDMDVLKKEEE